MLASYSWVNEILSEIYFHVLHFLFSPNRKIVDLLNKVKHVEEGFLSQTLFTN